MLLSNFVAKGVYQILSNVNNFVSSVAKECGIKDAIFFALLAVAFTVIGVLGLRLKKPVSAVLMGGMGFLGGYVLYSLLYGKIDFLSKISIEKETMAIILGAILAVVLVFLGWKRFMYVFVAVASAFGYYIAAHYLSANMFLDFAIAALVGLLCLCFVKLAMILFTGFGGALFTVSFVSQLLPKVNALQLGAEGNDVGMLIVLCLSVIFVAIQLFTTRNYEFR